MERETEWAWERERNIDWMGPDGEGRRTSVETLSEILTEEKRSLTDSVDLYRRHVAGTGPGGRGALSACSPAFRSNTRTQWAAVAHKQVQRQAYGQGTVRQSNVPVTHISLSNCISSQLGSSSCKKGHAFFCRHGHR